jgi:hypothetical protein
VGAQQPTISLENMGRWKTRVAGKLGSLENSGRWKTWESSFFDYEQLFQKTIRRDARRGMFRSIAKVRHLFYPTACSPQLAATKAFRRPKADEWKSSQIM